MNISSRLVLLLLVSSIGCGAEGSLAGPPPAASAGTDVEVPAPPRLRIEIVPTSEETWMPIFNTGANAIDPAHLTGDAPLVLAIGEGYPEDFKVILGEAYIGGCGKVAGAFTIQAVTSSSDDVTVEFDARSYRIRGTVEATVEVTVTGSFAPTEIRTCTQWNGGETPFRLAVPVNIRRPAHVELHLPESCKDASALRVESGAEIPGLILWPVDSDGEVFYPANATQYRKAAVTVLANDDRVSLSLADLEKGIESLIATGEGSFQITSDHGDVWSFEVVPPAAIDGMDARFSLLGFGGGGTVLESGKSYGDKGFARTSSTIGVSIAALIVDGDPVCTLPRSEDFALASEAPAVCPTTAGAGHGDNFQDTPIAQTAEVIVSGVCSLRLTARAFAGGAGLEQELSVTIHNAEGLIRLASAR